MKNKKQKPLCPQCLINTVSAIEIAVTAAPDTYTVFYTPIWWLYILLVSFHSEKYPGLDNKINGHSNSKCFIYSITLHPWNNPIECILLSSFTDEWCYLCSHRRIYTITLLESHSIVPLFCYIVHRHISNRCLKFLIKQHF